jgi:adenylate kinase
LRRNPKELKGFMERCGYVDSKLWENLQAEIVDVCLVEAIQTQQGKVCELDVTGLSVDEVVRMILDVLDERKACYVGIVDWLGILEQEGLTDRYLKV